MCSWCGTAAKKRVVLFVQLPPSFYLTQLREVQRSVLCRIDVSARGIQHGLEPDCTVLGPTHASQRLPLSNLSWQRVAPVRLDSMTTAVRLLARW